MSCKGFISDEVWEIKVDADDSGDSDPRFRTDRIQGDLGDSNNSGDSNSADSRDSVRLRTFKLGGFRGP